MELVKRYIAAVQRQLPASEREEIGRELEANILDKLDAIAAERPLTHEDTVQVLQQMGPPREVAAQFAAPQPLISAEYLPLYKYTLYMVLGILFVIQVVETTTAWLQGGFGLLLYFKGILSGMINDGVFAFTAITVGFMVMSRSSDRQCQQARPWTPESLPPAGPGWRHISLQDIFTDLATYTFLLVIIWYPLTASTPATYFFSESALGFLHWFSPVIIGGIALCLWQLSARWWTPPMQLASIAVNTALVLGMLYLAMSGPVLQVGTDLAIGLSALQVEKMFTWMLLFLACIPTYEVLRDIRRMVRDRAVGGPVAE